MSPIALRTMNQLSNSNAAAFVSPTILEFNNSVFENGPRGFYSYETVYYYRSRGEKLMSEKCPGGYQIDREEYVFNGREGPEGRRYHDSYFGYTDPDDENAPYLRKEYRITFHAAAPTNGLPATKLPPPAPPSGSAVPAPLPPGVEGKEELPPPRPLKSSQE